MGLRSVRLTGDSVEETGGRGEGGVGGTGTWSRVEEEEGWLEGRKKEKTGGKGTEQDEEETKVRKTDKEKTLRFMGQAEEEKKKQLQKEKGG